MKSIELVYDRLSVDWTPEEDEAFNEVERQSNLGKQILQEIKPKREWVSLTDEEIEHAYMHTANFVDMARVLEDILQEKNT